MHRYFSFLYAVAIALGTSAAESTRLSVLPLATAAHFCQLLVCDNTGTVQSLDNYIRRHPSNNSDSLSDVQSFCTYIFNYGGWQSLRIFPHARANRTVTWYAAEELLPDDIDPEHQKYIHDVFPRLIAEIETGNWPQVDAYIDRMLKYQTTFAALQAAQDSHPTPYSIILILPFVVFLALPLFIGKKSVA